MGVATVVPSPVIPPPLYIQTVFAEELPVYASSTEEKISFYADKYSVNEDHFRKTIYCESGASSTIQSAVVNATGEREASYGIAQIHMLSHPNITIEQAKDVDFSLDFMAKAFATGHADMWTCWRKMYGA